jgi:hypothetical protein
LASAAFLVLASLATSGCATFVAVDTSGSAPVFTWPADRPVRSLSVMPVVEDCDGPARETAQRDRYWWQISGDLKPPITYGQLPPGANESMAARPLLEGCDTWVVTVANGMQSESTRF